MVLSGGIAKGAYQIGFCKALQEFIGTENVKAFCGSSVGSINAFAIANDKVEEAIKLWRSINIRSFRDFKDQVITNNFLYDYIGMLASDCDVSVDCYITCCKAPALEIKYFNLKACEGEYARKIICASISLPPLMRPIEIDGRFYIDGAFLNNIPVEPIMNIGFDYIIVVHFDPSVSMQAAESLEIKQRRIKK